MSHHMGELWRRGFGVEAFNSHISNYIGHGGFNQDYVMPQIKNLPFRNVKYWTEEDKKIAAAYMPKISMALSFLPLTYGRLKQEGLIIAPQEGRAKGKIIPISENPVEWFKSL